MHKLALSVPEMMALVGISRSKLYEEIALGRLPARKIGRRTVFLAKDVELYLESLDMISCAPVNSGPEA